MASSQDALICLSGISKVYRTEALDTHALQRVSLEVPRGDYLTVVGPSGCGKSTLLSLLGLLDTPSSGTYLLDGQPVQGLGPDQRARLRNRSIGFVFQSFNLIDDLTVNANVALPLVYAGVPAAERAERVAQALARVQLGHRGGHLPGQLSGGQQQRVAVARAIVGRPLLLLADEPTGNLDSRSGAAVMDLLDELHAGGATIVMVTHDPRFVGRARRVLELLDGQVAHGPAPVHRSSVAAALSQPALVEVA